MFFRLSAVIDGMVGTWKMWEGKLGKDCEEITDRVVVQRDTLRKEVEKYCKERGVEGY